MANKSLTFSDVEIRDDGTNLIFITDGTTVLEINKTTGVATSLSAVSGEIGSVQFPGSGDIVSGVTTYLQLDPVTDDLTVNGQANFTNPVTVPQVNISNQTGAETCGDATYNNLAVNTIATTAVTGSSIIILTPHSDTPDGELFVQSISSGTSFTVGYSGSNSTQRFYWLIVNPV